jgi:serpin B
MSVLHDGAGLAAYGETARELRELLGVAGPEAASAVTEVTAQLARTEGIAVATGVWSRIPVYRGYRERLPEVGFGHLALGAPPAGSGPPYL